MGTLVLECHCAQPARGKDGIIWTRQLKFVRSDELTIETDRQRAISESRSQPRPRSPSQGRRSRGSLACCGIQSTGEESDPAEKHGPDG